MNALGHPMERVSTHKITYRSNEYFRYRTFDRSLRSCCAKHVIIGHDVWIGHGAVIMPGMIVGHGAIIGENAVITKDVMPYTVVVGIPAKRLRMRFPDNVIEDLLDIAWWDWPLEKIHNALPDMQNLSIEAFVCKWK